MVLTSHNTLGNTGHATGFWLEEFAAPYYVFKDADANITLASPKGGLPPMDPKSEEPDFQTEDTQRFNGDAQAQALLAKTIPLSEIEPQDFDAVFYPGGHGPLWDLVDDKFSIRIIESLFAANKPVAAVCHAPAVLLNAKTEAGKNIVCKKSVTGFSNSEEAAVELSDIVPFLLENALIKAGGQYSKADDWQAYVVTDGNLITGQNPASSAATAHAVLAQL